MADAGVDQRVETATSGNVTVTLSGSGTDADGDTFTYSWSQVSGTSVTLINASTATATFSVSGVTTNTELEFQLSVSDGTLSGTDKVVIVLLPDAGANCTVVDATAGSYPAWEAGTYKQPAKVNHRGLVWQARWETTAEPLITATAWPAEAWGIVSAVEMPWHPDRVYGGTAIGQSTNEVNHNGRRWRASWWHKNQEPGGQGVNVWTDIGASTCPW